MAATPEEKTFKSHFQNYNYDLYAIDLYQQWIGAKKYRNMDENQKKIVLNDYFEKLKSKTKIDLIFNRKSEFSKNQDALNKLKELADDELVKQIDDFMQQPFTAESDKSSLLGDKSYAVTKSLQSQISYVNGHRLDLVWSRNLIDTLLGLKYLKNTNVQAVSANIALLNGVASYGFYFIRGGMDLMKLIRHTLITDHEELKQEDISVRDKLRLQWGLRYASIINDIILWGPVNLVTFHFLFGMGSLGYFGNLLTAGLLFCDFALNLYNLIHTQNKFNALKKELTEKGVNAKIIEELKAQHLKTMRDLTWYVAYSAALCGGFIALCNFLIPGPGLTVMLKTTTLMFGSIAILGLQIVLNLKNMIIKWRESGDSTELKKIAVFEATTRILSQSLIPASLLLSSLLIPATGLPPMFIGIAALAVSSLIIKVINDLTDRYVLTQEIRKLNKDKLVQRDAIDPYHDEDRQEIEALIKQKKDLLGTNLHQLVNDSSNCVKGIMAITAIGMGLMLASTPLAPLIALPIVMVLLVMGLDHYRKQNAPNPPLALA